MFSTRLIQTLRRLIVLTALLLFTGAILPKSTLFVHAARQNELSRMVINYTEVDEQERQRLRIFFTLTDSNGRAANTPVIDAVQLILNNQIIAGSVTVPTEPLNIALVLDASGSMLPAAAAMREAAITAVNTAPQGTRFSVIQFNEQIITRAGFSDDREAIVTAIDTMSNDQFEGGTCLYDATLEALETLQIAGIAGRRAVVLFTDGRDELVAGGELDRCSINADYNRLIETARNPQYQIPIYTIALIGTQTISQQELQSLAENTGGLAVSGADTELTSLFIQIIQSFAGQRIATFDLCVPLGEYSGLMNVNLGSSNSGGSGELIAPVGGLDFLLGCTPPSPTPTALPLVLAIGNIRFDAPTGDIVFDVQRAGTGNVSFYRVEVIDQATGVLIPGSFGQITLPGDTTGEVRIPLNQITALEWLIRVSAYDANGTRIALSEPAEVIPERTATPTPPPTTTFTPEPTSTPTVTPVVPTIDISSIQYLSDRHEFILNLRLGNVSADTVSGYTVRVENAAQIQVSSETRLILPSTRVTFPALNAEAQPLLPGEYLITLEITTRSGGAITASREVVVPPPPPLPSPTPEPPLNERIRENIDRNPVLAVGFVLFALGILFLLVLFITRVRADRRSYGRPAFQQSYRSARQSVGGATEESGRRGGSTPRTDSGGLAPPPSAPEVLPSGITARITIIQSPDPQMQSGRSFEVNTLEYRVGRAMTNDLVINADGVSKLHFVLKWMTTHFVIQDLNSTNHTLLANQKLEVMRNEPLEPGKEYTIMAGKRTRLQFVYYLSAEARAQIETHTEIEFPEAPQVRATPVVPTPASHAFPNMQRATPSVTEPTHEDVPTYVSEDDLLLPGYVQAEVILTTAQGENAQPLTAVATTFGRKSTNTHSFENVEVSREHARLDWENGEFVLRDLGSSNGTFVDEERITNRDGKRLEPGKLFTLRLGKPDKGVTIKFQYWIHNVSSSTSDEDEPTQV